MREWTFGQAVMSVVRADITQLAVESIVNAANSTLWMGGGVAGAIKRAGGSDIERDALAQGPIAVGDAVVTSAGRLPCRYVIHAATMGPDLETNAHAIRSATRSALRRANDLGLASIAFPALGTGVGGFPIQEAATLMAAEIGRHLHEGSSLRRIVIAVFTTDAEHAFSAAFDRLNGGQ
jgi:O-acetyl-ADP-ribose deacetylase (regulator of RNase III)